MSKIELGRVGAALAPADNREFLAGVRQLEEIGVSTIWLTGGQIQRLSQITAVLLATDHVRVASGIISVDRFSVAEVAALYDELEVEHPGRFVVGLGGAHGPKPIETLTAYLEALTLVPQDRIVLAALGPRMLAFARERAVGRVPRARDARVHGCRTRAVGRRHHARDRPARRGRGRSRTRAHARAATARVPRRRCRSTRPTSGAWVSPTTRSRRAPTVSSTRSCRGATPIPSPRRSPRTTRRAPITSRSAWSAGRTRCPSSRWRRWYLRSNAIARRLSPVEEARPARRSWVGGNPSSRRAGRCRVTDRPSPMAQPRPPDVARRSQCATSGSTGLQRRVNRRSP